MKRLLVASLLALAAAVVTSDTASAQYPENLGFLPYGFYQPYGARYGTSIRTPPYFATNPPVYYGARHARPYGVSPFASPPVVSAGAGYESRLRTQFLQPQIPTPEPQLNPCVSHSCSLPAAPRVGKVQLNPFVEPADHLAKN
jgi:hypothetical protein